jgi:hypothetical protein
MRVVYKGHEIDVRHEMSMGGWSQLYFSVFRLSDNREITSGFSEGADKVHDFVGYMKNRVDGYIADPSEEFPEDSADEIDQHRAAIIAALVGLKV